MEHGMVTMSDLGRRMSMGGSNPDACLIRMTWNWNTINACFISESWHIRSKGMFAGSCIGVILLVVLLEFLRRATKEYDRYLVRSHQAKFLAVFGGSAASDGAESGSEGAAAAAASANKAGAGVVASCSPGAIPQAPPFRPTVIEQAIRSFLHVCQFAVAYFIMLLAMYYNGYIIICIFIGAYIGAFAFQWEILGASTKAQTSAANEATVCCG